MPGAARTAIVALMHRTYPISVPIETNHGRGETRAVGPTHITFATASLFASGDTLRFALSLRGTGTPVEVVGNGRVESVTPEGDLFVVAATVEGTAIALLKEGERA